MRYRPPFVTLIFLAVFGLMLTGAGCKKTPSSPDPLDPDADGVVTEDEFRAVWFADQVEMTFAHVKPGEYSEVYLKFRASPNKRVRATLSGPSVASPATQTLFTDEDGFVRFVWRVYSSGSYSAQAFDVGPRGDGEEPRFLVGDAVRVQ